MQQPQIGESLVGAYLRIVEECQFVTYNRKDPDKNQSDTDVVALKTDEEDQTIYGCEVVTHLDGPRYRTSKDSSDWDEFNSYAETFRDLEDKFETTFEFVSDLWPDADSVELQFWSPVVPGEIRPKGLEEFQRRFSAEHGIEIDMVYNEKYAKRLGKLQREANNETSSHDEPAFRFLQVLEHVEDYK
jgi:hypothetical protein